MTDLATYLLALGAGPMLRGDVIVVLCGEDGQARADVGLQLFAQRAGTHLVLSGGRHEPPAILGAAHLREDLVSRGVSPDRILVEDQSRNTWEQAVAVTALAQEYGWHRLLLVASSYHLPRAFLSFVAAIPKGHDLLHVIPVAATQAPLWQCPPGGDRTRMALWHVETVKIAEYQAMGHCASYESAVAYLQRWEGK